MTSHGKGGVGSGIDGGLLIFLTLLSIYHRGWYGLIIKPLYNYKGGCIIHIHIHICCLCGLGWLWWLSGKDCVALLMGWCFPVRATDRISGNAPAELDTSLTTHSTTWQHVLIVVGI